MANTKNPGPFASWVPKGENPGGITVITANGVAHAGGDYPRNQQTRWPGETGTDGPRWNNIAGSEYSPTAGVFPGSAAGSPPRSTKRNRSGE